MEKLLTAQDLAEACGVPLKTVYTWSSNGTGPRRIRVGKHIRFRLADVEKWLDAQSAAPP